LAKDFAGFLKERSVLEDKHAQGLKKLCRSTFESMRRPDNRQGSYVRNYEELARIHDRMAENGTQFSLALHQMQEDLNDLAAKKDIARKQWKASGLAAEKRAQDSEAAMEKAQAKYNALAEDYDRTRTGDRVGGKFSLKGHKSAAQVEEELHRKVQAADTDYSSKVQLAQGMRRDLEEKTRPQTIQNLQQLINEADSALTLQMQRFGTCPSMICGCRVAVRLMPF
jgi:Rho GTPase-activating protein RGD1